MIGTKFGRWSVTGACVLSPRGERKWPCRCDCGKERLVLERTLRSGDSQSCGCARKERKGNDLTGQTFGNLTALHRSQVQKKSGGIWWHCQCSCGETYDCPGTLLSTGRRTCCPSKVHRTHSTAVDIQNQRFGMLTALHPTDQRDRKGFIIWHCRCDCGKEVDISYNVLRYTGQISCGCRKEEKAAQLGNYLTHIADTSLERVKSKKIQKNNTTGHRGIYFYRGKYMAKITFQRKTYFLGNYEHIEDAIEARLDAEEQLFDTTADFYEKWTKKAREDPQWASENPIQIQVCQTDSHRFQLSLLPVMESLCP